MPDYSDRLRKSEWDVRTVSMEVARKLISDHHYARGASNTRTYLHGLFRKEAFFDDDCLGVAWWIPPIKAAAVATYPQNWKGVLSLSRLVVAPGVPKNACTFLLSRSAKLIPASDWPCLVTYADEWKGHTGTIYRACNWSYAGKSSGNNTYTLNGRLVSKKATSNRTHAEMIASGAANLGKHPKHKFVLIRS